MYKILRKTEEKDFINFNSFYNKNSWVIERSNLFGSEDRWKYLILLNNNSYTNWSYKGQFIRESNNAEIDAVKKWLQN